MNADSHCTLGQQPVIAKDKGDWLIAMALVCSGILHALIAYNWHAPAVEPFPSVPPKVIEVALVTPPPPIEKVVEPPKPKVVKPVVKQKPVEKPKVKPKPVVPPKPKAPPKVMQKTFTEAAPEIKESKPDYSSVPVFSKPIPSPKATTNSPAKATGTAKPASSSQGNSSSGVVVLERVKPRYPSRALSRHIEGHVTIQFTVNAAGRAENASVTSAAPSGVFEDAALDAISQWKFKQKIVNGVAVSQRAVQTLHFKLDR